MAGSPRYIAYISAMRPSHSLYKALAARDPRFDGIFYVGVTSTGIYCRPVCRAKTPKEANCVFFDTAQQAERARFRPCLRCRPELAPGNAPVDAAQRIARLIVERLEDGMIAGDAGLEAIARQFELSTRQIRRIVQKELGVAPVQLLLTRRLLLAKQLLTETQLPVTEIAYASGFASLRRFNDAFVKRYGMPPSSLRRQAVDDLQPPHTTQTSTLQLSYRPPYDWPGVLAFLAAREVEGVEHVTDGSYSRTVQLGGSTGWIRVTHANGRGALLLEFSHTLIAVLPALLTRVRNLFDLDARPDVINAQLGRDADLATLVERTPGMRVPGAFSGFELAVRAIIGQQVSVKTATTLACRYAAAFGERIATPIPQLSRLTPAPAWIARAKLDDIAKLGIVSARARSIITLARAHISGELSLESGAHPDPEAVIEKLAAIPGIGPWTAHYIAMRARRWPDAFPKEDIVIRRKLGGVTPKQAEARSQVWRPWRSYAVLHLWGK